MENNSEETLRNYKIFQRIISVKFGVLTFSENQPLLTNTIFPPPRILRRFRQLHQDTSKPAELWGTHGWAGSWNSPLPSLVQDIFMVLWKSGTCFPISYLLAGMQEAFTYFWPLALSLTSLQQPWPRYRTNLPRHTTNKVNAAFFVKEWRKISTRVVLCLKTFLVLMPDCFSNLLFWGFVS